MLDCYMDLTLHIHSQDKKFCWEIWRKWPRIAIFGPKMVLWGGFGHFFNFFGMGAAYIRCISVIWYFFSFLWWKPRLDIVHRSKNGTDSKRFVKLKMRQFQLVREHWRHDRKQKRLIQYQNWWSVNFIYQANRRTLNSFVTLSSACAYSAVVVTLGSRYFEYSAKREWSRSKHCSLKWASPFPFWRQKLGTWANV